MILLEMLQWGKWTDIDLPAQTLSSVLDKSKRTNLIPSSVQPAKKIVQI